MARSLELSGHDEVGRPRVAASAACALAVGIGIVGMWRGGAPPAYTFVNGGALAVALTVIRLLRPPSSRRGLLMVGGVLTLTLAATLVDQAAAIDGVRRWVSVGPVRLHAGMLVLPSLAVVAMAARGQAAAAALAVAGVVAAAQPDCAAALALVCVCMAGWWSTGDRWMGAAFAVAVAALAVTLLRSDGLAAVPFVEHVLHDAWAVSPSWAVVQALGLAAATAAPSWAARDRAARPAALALSACLGGFVAASLLGPYPTPLVGFGASPILGVGLALALLPTKLPDASSPRPSARRP